MIVQPVVSGRIQQDQACIITAVINSQNYFLTSDVNDVPFFMQLRNSLDIFTATALRVKVTLSVGSRQPMMTIRHADTDAFYVENPVLNYISSPDPQTTQHALFLDAKSNFDNSLLAVGVSYTLTSPYYFLAYEDETADPKSINAPSAATTRTTNFFVTQVGGLVDSTGASVQKDVMSTIFAYTTSDTVSTYFFTSLQDSINGAGIPYSFCSTMTCGTNCLGTCPGGDYSTCKRELDSQAFSCVKQDTSTCVFTYLAILIVIYVILAFMFGFLFFGHHFNLSNRDIMGVALGTKHEANVNGKTVNHDNVDSKIGFHATTGRVIFGFLFGLFVLAPFITLALVRFDPSVSRAFLGQTCAIK